MGNGNVAKRGLQADVMRRRRQERTTTDDAAAACRQDYVGSDSGEKIFCVDEERE